MGPLVEPGLGVSVSRSFLESVHPHSPPTLSSICSRLRQRQSVGCLEWSTVRNCYARACGVASLPSARGGQSLTETLPCAGLVEWQTHPIVDRILHGTVRVRIPPSPH